MKTAEYKTKSKLNTHFIWERPGQEGGGRKQWTIIAEKVVKNLVFLYSHAAFSSKKSANKKAVKNSIVQNR